MKTIELRLDYLDGPIYNEYVINGKKATGIKAIDENVDIQSLNQEIQDLYSSYFEFNSHDQPCWFNKEQEKADKEKMLTMIAELIEMLNKINDGSFVIDDQETERIRGL